MAIDSAHLARRGDHWSVIAALVAADGSAGHAMARRLSMRSAPPRDLADAVHALCWLHGRTPGVIDHTVVRHAHPLAQDWLVEAAAAFAAERGFIARLTSAAGHTPSTPGQAESEAAVLGQRHALDMLAQSDRAGCATGAAIALVLDWSAIRRTLETAAHRFGVEPPHPALPHDAEIETIVLSFGDTPAVERAMAFGAQQLLAQHRGLWDLLEARASARDRA